MHNKLKKISLLIGDILVLYLSLYLTLLLRYRTDPFGGDWQKHVVPFTIIFIGWLLVFYIANLYDLHLAANNTKFFQRTAEAFLAGALVAVSYFYINPALPIAPKRNLFIFIVIFYIFFILWRQFYNRLLKSYLPRRHIAIIGYNKLAQELAQELAAKPHLGYAVSFAVNDRDNDSDHFRQDRLPLRSGGQDAPAAIPIIDGYAHLDKVITENKVTAIVLTSDPHQSPALRDSLFACLPLKIDYLNLPNFYENITGKIPIEDINQMWFLENLSEGSKGWFNSIKRIYDIVLAAVILLATAVFWVLIAIVIKLESPGPAFYLSTRLGKNNRPFRLVKFRTMRESGNDRSPTKSNDPRITGFGNFLRTTRIDELPQVLNIIIGDMSFVGPRPERPELVENLVKVVPFYRERALVKPGLTGWDQISGEYHSPSYEDTMKKLQYDLYYIKNRSLYLDLSIILKTIATVLSRAGR